MLIHSQENQKSRKTPQGCTEASREMNRNSVKESCHALLTVFRRTDSSYFPSFIAHSVSLVTFLSFLPSSCTIPPRNSTLWCPWLFPLYCTVSLLLCSFSCLPFTQFPKPSGLFLPTGKLPELDTRGSFFSCCFLITSPLCSFFLVLCSIFSASGAHIEAWELPGMSW